MCYTLSWLLSFWISIRCSFLYDAKPFALEQVQMWDHFYTAGWVVHIYIYTYIYMYATAWLLPIIMLTLRICCTTISTVTVELSLHVLNDKRSKYCLQRCKLVSLKDIDLSNILELTHSVLWPNELFNSTIT